MDWPTAVVASSVVIAVGAVVVTVVWQVLEIGKARSADHIHGHDEPR